ncbi:carboxymuconolactone decarboxylase family protein [Streptomyces sp. NPDC050418]|uniref:carboxymuconolactone decarboxylase family protein n=1 Tax=Streptomyces sp. NPDC050418 TaxID=3365612 RepID=UPI0037B6A60A
MLDAQAQKKVMALLGESPELLKGFLELSAALEGSTLDPLAREVVIMTLAVRNGCHVCVLMHTGKLRGLDAEPERVEKLIKELGEQRELSDERLEAARQFTLDLLATTGAVSDRRLAEFLSHGYTRRNALEVVLAIGAYTMSTFANRLMRAEV